MLETAAMASLTIEAQQITVRHNPDRAAVQAVSLRVEPGEQIALIGPSGAGKTTLLSVLGAARQPEEGQLLLAGANPWAMRGRAMRTARQRLFIAPQVPPLPPRQRVVTAVMAGQLPVWSLWRTLRSLWYASDAAEAYRALQTFSLGDKLWSRVDRLSGGERQRVSLARGLVSRAEALFIDEPLSALDPALAEQTLRALVDHACQRQATLVCSLHQVDLALAHFPRIVGLRDGELVFDLPTAQVSRQAVQDLYFGRESDSDGSASIHSLVPGAGAEAGAVSIASRCA